jgi:hypothetical protein
VQTRPGFFLLVRMKVMELPTVTIFPPTMTISSNQNSIADATVCMMRKDIEAGWK